MATQHYPGTWQVAGRTVSQGYALYTLSKNFTAIAWHMRKMQVPTMAQLAAASPYTGTTSAPSQPAAPAVTRLLRALAATFKRNP